MVFTLHIETLPDLTHDPEVYERFEEAMRNDRIADGAAATLSGDGRLSATFQVEARAMPHATELGIKAFYRGLAAAGFDVERPGWRLLVDTYEGGDALEPPPPRYELEELLTGGEAAELLGVSRQRVGQLAEGESFPEPVGRVGNAIVWRRGDLERWQLERNRHVHTHDSATTRESGTVTARSSVSGKDAVVRVQPAPATARGIAPDIIIENGESVAVVEVKAITDREREILELLREGLTNREIADRLGILPGSVAMALSRLYKKLRVTNRQAAAALELVDES